MDTDGLLHGANRWRTFFAAEDGFLSRAKVHFGLDDERLGALREELLYAHPGKVVEDGQGLVWTAGRVARQTLNAVS